MPVSRTKSMESLYAACADFNRVVVPDPPLASALNRRLDEPHFGPFAITPRRLAARRVERAEDRTAFLEVVDETDLDWKTVSHAVGNVLQCWEHTGRADGILEYDAYDTEATRTVLEHVASLDTTSKRLEDFKIDPDKSTAVVGVEQLTALERSILPSEYESIDPFTDEAFDLPPFHILDSPGAMIDVVLDTVSEDTAGDVAVVLDAGSEYSTLLEAALEDADVPFVGGPGFDDAPEHRGVLQLLRAGHAGSDTRVADVRALLTHLDHDVPVAHDAKRLADVDHPGVDWLEAFASDLETRTFADVLDGYETQTGASLDAFRAELENLGLLDVRATESRVDDLAFYLDAYDVPVDREKNGVLLADASQGGHVDRPLVFYLAMDDDWTHRSPRRPWIDEDAQYERHVRGFQRLLQNGVDQYYLVQESTGGSPVTPCLYFEDLLETSVERFSDLESIRHTRRDRSRESGFDRHTDAVDVAYEPLETISQSSLNTYVNCPRDYLFDRLLEGPDRDYFVEGTLFHDFAECYAADPEGTPSVDAAADDLLDAVDPFIRDVDRTHRRTRYRLGLETITDYLDANPPVATDLDLPDSAWIDNAVADAYDVEVDDAPTEVWFDDPALGVKGLVDLIASPTRLVDYKSGSRKTPRTVRKRAALDPPDDTPNFQILLYLTYLRSLTPDARLEFTFLHFLETVPDRLTGDHDLEDCLTTISYLPVSFETHVASEAVFTALQEDAPGDCRKTFSQIEYADYREVVEAHDVPATTDNDELAGTAFASALQSRLEDLVGDYKYVETATAQACRHIAGLREQHFFPADLDAFEAFVADRLEELNARRRGDERFPVKGLAGDPNYRRVDHRDCILEGGRG